MQYNTTFLPRHCQVKLFSGNSRILHRAIKGNFVLYCTYYILHSTGSSYATTTCVFQDMMKKCALARLEALQQNSAPETETDDDDDDKGKGKLTPVISVKDETEQQDRNKSKNKNVNENNNGIYGTLEHFRQRMVSSILSRWLRLDAAYETEHTDYVTIDDVPPSLFDSKTCLDDTDLITCSTKDSSICNDSTDVSSDNDDTSSSITTDIKIVDRHKRATTDLTYSHDVCLPTFHNRSVYTPYNA